MDHLLKYRWLIFCALLVAAIVSILYLFCINTTEITDEPQAKLNPAHREVIQWLSNHTVWQQQGTNEGWAGFDKVYFIALPKRLGNVKQVADRLGITHSAWILSAIYKDALDPHELLALNIIEAQYLKFLTPRLYGCIGCQLSHLAVMLDCYKDPTAQTCVIFEDDLYRPAKAVTAQIIEFRKRVEKLKINWDLLYLDYCFEEGHKQGETDQENDIRWLTGSACTHAFVIKKSAVPIILAASLPMQTTFDGILIQLMKHKKIIAIGPDKARYFAQNRMLHGSTISTGFIDYPTLNLRFLQQ